ncbi:MAG TPA: hypothetical protein VFR24_06700 [Candidatus Angelobacter sp.]|nr:hypothetical protein [Candidatus Angelobacter sp.]
MLYPWANISGPFFPLFFTTRHPRWSNSHCVVWQIMLLGLIFNVGGTAVNLGVAYAGGTLGELLRRNARFARVQQWFTGLVFIGLGARLAWQRR